MSLFTYSNFLLYGGISASNIWVLLYFSPCIHRTGYMLVENCCETIYCSLAVVVEVIAFILNHCAFYNYSY